MSKQAPLYGKLLALILAAGCPSSGYAAQQDLAEIARAAEQHADRKAREMRYRNINARANALDSRLSLADCGHPLQTFSAPGKAAGRTTVGVRCTTPKPWTLYVPVTVAASVETVALREALPRGSVLSERDLVIKLQPAHSVRSAYIASIAAASGKQLRRDLRADTPLYLNMLTNPKAVERGQSTLILSAINNIDVRMNGTALSSGAAGDTVKVRNESSGKTIEGVVLENGSVRIP